MTAPYTPLPPPSVPAGGPGPWSDEQPPSRARPAGQAAVWAVCSLAVILAAAAATVPGWGVALAAALAAGIGVGLAADVGRWFTRWSGLVAAMLTVVVGFSLVAMSGGPAAALGVVLVLASFVAGLDWTRVDRLRPLPLLAGVLVVLTMLGGEPWMFAMGVLWLALAFGALSLLEADRRAGQPRAQPPMGAGPPQVRTGDVLSTVLLALALALVAALVLSVPSCQQRLRGGSGSGPGQLSGSGFGSGSGTGSAADPHRYVPDPSGRYLIPDGGGAPGGASGSPIPRPDLLPQVGEGQTRTDTGSDGTSITVRGLPGGDREVTVTGPSGDRTRYRYHDQPDGLTRIDRLGPDGQVTDTYWYDPQGQTAAGGPVSTSVPQDQPPKAKRPRHGPSARAIAIAVALVAALAGLIWYLVRRARRRGRRSDPDTPTWALALVARLEAEGRARGRARRPEEPVVAYARALAEGPLPDARLGEVAAIASHALFARTDPGPAARQQAESALDAALAAHPVPEPERRRLVRSR